MADFAQVGLAQLSWRPERSLAAQQRRSDRPYMHAIETVDYVDGSVTKNRFKCNDMRSMPHQCGPDAKLWQPKNDGLRFV